MTTIDDLGKSITEMTDEELFALHREVRQSRRTSKRAAKASTKKKVNTVALVKSLSEEDRRKLIEELEGIE